MDFLTGCVGNIQKRLGQIKYQEPECPEEEDDQIDSSNLSLKLAKMDVNSFTKLNAHKSELFQQIKRIKVNNEKMRRIFSKIKRDNNSNVNLDEFSAFDYLQICEENQEGTDQKVTSKVVECN